MKNDLRLLLGFVGAVALIGAFMLRTSIEAVVEAEQRLSAVERKQADIEDRLMRLQVRATSLDSGVEFLKKMELIRADGTVKGDLNRFNLLLELKSGISDVQFQSARLQEMIQKLDASIGETKKRPNQPLQRNAGSRPSSGDSPASESPSSLGPRG